MKVQYGKDVANHSGPESCGGAREGAAEALTGETGRSAIEPRNQNSGTPTQLSDAEGNTEQGDKSQVLGRSRAVGDPVHAGKFPAQKLGDLHRARRRRRRAAQGRPRATRLAITRWRSRMRSYYLGSRRTKATSPRRWWREGAQPKGTLNRTPHPGHRAGPVVRRWVWKAYVKQRAGIGGCGSRRYCITLRRSYWWTASIASRRTRRRVWME